MKKISRLLYDDLNIVVPDLSILCRQNSLEVVRKGIGMGGW